MQVHRVPAFVAGVLLTIGAAAAQTPVFEVASVKPAQPPNPMAVLTGQQRIGLKVDAARVQIGFLSFADLMRIAYRLKEYQIVGPDWIQSERFDISAKIPEGTSTEQVPEMLQALLKERFGLVVRKETREQPVYALVTAKGGHKMKETAPAAPASEDDDKGGFTVDAGQGPMRITPDMQNRGVSISGPQFGAMKMSAGPGGGMHMESEHMTMAGLVEFLGRFVDKAVVDRTELKGIYQVAVDLSTDDLRNAARGAGFPVRAAAAAAGRGAGPAAGGEPGALPGDIAEAPGSSLFSSVQKLGLRLEGRKLPVETIVVEKAERTPTEN